MTDLVVKSKLTEEIMKKVLVISLLLVFVTAFVSCNAVNVDFFALDDERYRLEHGAEFDEID